MNTNDLFFNVTFPSIAMVAGSFIGMAAGFIEGRRRKTDKAFFCWVALIGTAVLALYLNYRFHFWW